MTRTDRANRRAADVALGVAAIVPALIDQATTETSTPAWTAMGGYVVVVVAALGVRRRWPLAAFCTILGLLAAAEVSTAAVEVELSDLSILSPAFALYAVGAYSPPRRSVAALFVGAALVAVGLLVNHATAPQEWRGGWDVVAFVAALPVAWALGVAARGHRASLAAAQRRADDARREQHLRAERAAAAERIRIARDMHDVVAHSLTLLVVHAETVRARSGELPPWARERIDALAAAGRQATGEMRELLDVLRDGTAGTAPRTPTPTLAGVPALVEAAESAGNPVAVTTTGDCDALPRPVQLACYRIVQEGLANARRHAPGADVRIRVDVERTRVDIEVASGPPPEDFAPLPGSGMGLPGLGERIAALGGELSTGPTEDGGFLIDATIAPTAGDDHDALR